MDDPNHHDRFITVEEFLRKPLRLKLPDRFCGFCWRCRLSAHAWPVMKCLPRIISPTCPFSATLANMATAYITACIPLVGRISVSRISHDRPKEIEGEDGGVMKYPFGDQPGPLPDGRYNSGSGFVEWLYETPEPCGFEGCTESSPDGCWQWVEVRTARHVAFDDVEAQHATFTLFNDSPNNPDQAPLPGGKWNGGSTDEDWCTLLFHHHDRALGRRLTELMATRDEALNKLRQNLPDISRCDNEAGIGLSAVLIGHPHGRCKHITVGEVKDTPPGAGTWEVKFVYSAPSCPGNSGCLVLPMGGWRAGWLPMRRPPHSVGGLPGGLGRSADFL